MKKIILIILVFVIFLNFNAYAAEIPLLDMRNRIFKECRDIQPLLRNSKDIIVINSMWSSCIMTVTQLDAYFSMVGIFNTVKDKVLTENPVIYLMKWLSEVKNTNELNIKSLDSIAYEVEPNTRVHIEKIKGYFNNLNNIIDGESARVSALQRSLKIKRQK
jgi:hypothetical protein